MADAKKMTPKQMRFCEEYLVDLNATQAAIRAGYSKRTAEKIGTENLHKPVIADEITRQLQMQSRRTAITADRILAEIARTAFLDPSLLYGDDGNILDIHSMPEDARRAIAGMDVDQRSTDEGDVSTTRKIKIADKLKALELLGRHFKMFTDKTEVTGKDGAPLVVVGGPSMMDYDEWERKAKEKLKPSGSHN